MGQAWKTTVVAVLLCTLAVGSAKAREPHRDLHGSQKSVAVADGRLKNTDGKTYFVVQPFGKGIVNAQLSVLKGLEAAKRHGYIFVVPPMVQWWAEHEPSYLLIIPFNHFYDADHFEKFAREYGAEIAWELPADRTPACTLQQQLSEKAPQAVNKATHRAWAQEYGVICLSGSSTFFTIDGADQPQFWPPDSLRQALKPSDLYASEAQKMLEEVGRQFGTKEFVSVHVRVEADWEEHCAAAKDRGDQQSTLFNNNHQCWVDEAQTAEILERKLKVRAGSLLYIQSTVPLKKMQKLCSKYKCFNRDSVWKERSEEIPYKKTSLVLSYLTSLLAEHGTAMYGNIHSAYYGELAKKFSAADKPAHHLNPDCPMNELCM
ncbi:hypothetical protein WJX75_004356 [Coccomyxa subellipsoidea]|uniref:O-fucosyltransferase family protein n=1 Tax=Coccomyxa subellipsoidea TaxID=248742 RepID=A0ABR2Z3K2_9CHLO